MKFLLVRLRRACPPKAGSSIFGNETVNYIMGERAIKGPGGYLRWLKK